MRKLLFILTMLSIMVQGAVGQWYQRQYGADNLRNLTSFQLKESSRKSVINIGIGTFSMAAGSMIMITGREKLESPDNQPFTNIFKSSDSVGYAFLGAAAFTAGATVVTSNIVRLIRIGSAKNRMFASCPGVDIIPTLQVGMENTIIPGVSLKIVF